jgi:hypothetical protein
VTAAPDFIAPVVGWRTWLVVERDEGLRLQSVLFDTLWSPRRELDARCRCRPQRQLLRPWRRLPGHDAPHLECGCGIYAAEQLESAAAYLDDYDRLHWRIRHRVIGRVALWGKVVACTRGWRASRAYPTRLFVPTGRVSRKTVDADAIALSLAEYGVPVEILEGDTRDRVVDALARVRLEPPATRRPAA